MSTCIWVLVPVPFIVLIALALSIAMTHKLRTRLPELSIPGTRFLCALAIAYLVLIAALVAWLAVIDETSIRHAAVVSVVAVASPLLLLLPVLVWHWCGAELKGLALAVSDEKNKTLVRMVERVGRFVGFATVLVVFATVLAVALTTALSFLESSSTALWTKLAQTPKDALTDVPAEALIWSQTTVLLALIVATTVVLIMLIRAVARYFNDQ